MKVDELYDDAAEKMNATNVDTLLKYITGNENASIQTNLRTTMEGLDNLATAVTTSAEIRQNVLTTTPQQKSSEQDVIVTLGGLDWQVVYLSKDNNGNDILTLWLSSSQQDAWGDRGATEGEYYGFVNGSLYSDWSADVSQTSVNPLYPSSMYGTSYVRAVTLNNGGSYSTSLYSASAMAEQSDSSVFARFTMEEVGGSLTSFFSVPGDVSWQLLQSAADVDESPSSDSLYANESINDPTGILGGSYGSYQNFHSKTGYDNWANDYLWLPSITEFFPNRIWETSASQRQNYIHSPANFSVGSNNSSGNAIYNCFWTRSANNGYMVYYMRSNGSGYYAYNSSYSLAVRPALHLNLNAVAVSALSGTENDLALTHAYIENQTVVEGEAVTPTPDIYFGDTLLVAGENYEISSYENNTAEGIGKMTITAVEGGGYVGEKTFAFVIGENLPDMANAEITYDETAVEWTGSAITKDVSVSYNGMALQEGVDYVLSFSNNTNIGTTAAIDIRGLGFYQNAQTAYFSIVRRSMTAENRIQVEGLSDMTYTGSALTPEFTVTDTELDMQLQSGTHFTYQFSNNTNAGPATLNLTGSGNYSGTLSFTFNIAQKDLSSGSFTLSNNSFTYNGQTQTPTITYQLDGVTLQRDRDFSITFHRTTADGEVVENPTDAGTYYIVLQGINNYSGVKSTSFVINQGTINSDAVTLAQNSFTFNRQNVTLDITVRVNNRILLENEYSLEIRKNSTSGEIVEPTEIVDAGTYYVTVRANNNNYTGYGTKSFVINQASVAGGTLVLADAGDGFVYAGTDVEPQVQSVSTNFDNNSLTLQQGEYSVSYSNNNGAGTATVTVQGTGNFTGTLQQTFTIEQGIVGSLEITFADQVGQNVETTYSGSAFAAPSVVVKDADGNLINSADYSLSFSSTDYENVGVINVSVAPRQNGGRYNYIGSALGTITISQKDLTNETVTITLEPNSYIYDGTQKRPDVTVQFGDKTLTFENDYTLSYQDNIDASENAKVQINFVGNYSGAKEQTFEIEPKNISSATATIENQTFTGDKIEPEFDVTDLVNGSNVRLVKDRDYSVEFFNNTNVTDVAEAVVTGKGNFVGEKTFYFQIVGRSISDAVVSAENVTYTGAENRASVSVLLDGEPLTDDDFSVSYQGDLVNVGVVTVVVTGKGNYSGQASTTYTIQPKDVSTLTITILDEQITYDRTAKTPEFSVFDGDTQVSNSSFYATYSNNINAGQGVLTLRASGNYVGTKQAQFVISKATISSATLFETDVVYTGEQIFVGVSEVKAGNVSLFASEYDVGYDQNINVGQAIVTVTAKETSNFTGSTTANFTISKAVISGFSLSATSAVYDRETQSISVSEVWTQNGLYVTEGYTVHHSRLQGEDYVETDDFVSAGTIRVTIELTNDQNFALASGVYADFVIERRNINSSIVVSYYTIGEDDLEDPLTGDMTYVGREVFPRLVYGTYTLQNELDYSYQITTASREEVAGAHSSAGDYVLTITGQDNYQGTIVKNYKVVAADLDFTNQEFDYVVNETFVYDGTAKTFADISTGLTISYHDELAGDITLDYIEDFTLYEGYYDLTNNTPLDEASEGEGVIFVDGGYFANVNAGLANLFIEGVGNYIGVARLTFTIQQRDLSDATISVDDGALVYDGTEKQPTFTVTLDGFVENLVIDEDFYAEFANNVNAGSNASVTIYGRNNFSGSASQTFSIAKRNISNQEEFVISSVEDVSYTGTEQKFSPQILFNGTPLDSEDDYLISYFRDETTTTDFVNVGEITIRFSGAGNFEGTREVSYNITKVDLGSNQVSKPGAISGGRYVLSDEVYDGTPKEKTLTLVFNSTNLREDFDFESSYSVVDLTSAQNNIILTVNGIGNFEGQLQFVYNILPASVVDNERFQITVSVPEAGATYTGEEIKPTVTIIDKGANLDQNNDVTSFFDISYQNNVNVIYQNGEIISGALILIEGSENYSEVYTINFKIIPVNLSTLSNEALDDVTYSGKTERHLPNLVFNDKALIEGEDFDVVFSTNNLVDAQDDISLTITGKGNFTGEISNSYSILKANISTLSERFEIVFAELSKTFTGRDILLDFTIEDLTKDAFLVEETDFEVDYVNNLNVGDDLDADAPTLTITGIGNYEGSVTQKFDITQKSISDEDVIVAQISNQHFTGEEVQPDVDITYNGITLKKDTDFSLDYDNNIEIGSQAKVIISGINNFSGTKEVFFTIVTTVVSGDTFDIILPQESVTYTGSEITFENIQVKFADSETVLPSENYEIVYQNNTNVGTASIFVVFSGNYVGTAVKEFEILAKNISDEDVILGEIQSFVYDGTRHIVNPSLTFNERPLTSADFSYEFDTNNFVDAKTITITITGVRNFEGSRKTTYQILAKKLDNTDNTENNVVIEVVESNLVYTGEEIKPQIIVTYGDIFLSDVDFDVSYSENEMAGEATVTITAKSSNYSSSLSQAFTILPKELEYSMLGELGTYSYTGFDVEPEVVLTYNNMPLGKDIDFSVSYSNNLNASDNALITISAVDNGNYSGSIEATFSITRLSLENAQVGGYLAEYDFNDTEIKPEFSITVAGYFEEDQETLKTLVNGVDFEVQYQDDCKNVGVKEVTIIGINNFSYLTSVEFEIVATNIESLTIEGFEESLPYNHGDGVTQNLVLKLGDNVIGSENYVISYQNNINAGETAELYITPSNANLTGEISRTFDIEKAAPVLNFVENLSGFDGDSLNELTVLGEGCTEGVLTFEQDSLMLGTTTYNYTFTPTDMDNYEIATGSIEIQVNTVELVGIEAESGRLVSGNVFDTSSVRVFGLYNNGARLEIQITECEVSISNGSTLAYGQNVTIRYAGFDTTLVVLRDSIQNNGFTVSSDIGIDEGVEFEVEIVDELIGIYEIIGEYYENYGNVEQIFVTTLTKDGEAYTDDRLVVTFDTATVQGNFVYYSLEDGKLVQLDVSGGTINFGSDGNIILALEVYSDFTMWIIIGAICLFALIIVVFVILLALRNRKKKRKKMSTSSNADSENFEQK